MKADLSGITILYIYLVPEGILKIEDLLKTCYER